MVNSDPSPPPSTRGNDLGPNTESTVNYALASDDGWEKKPALGNGQFTQGSNEYGAKFFTTIVENKRFQTFIHFLIVVNCIMMGIATTDLITQNPELESIFDAIDFTFLIIFTIELVFGFGAFGWGLFKSGWLTFDFFVVTLSWFFPALQVIRGFRALRLLTRIPYTRKIMQALHSVLPVMGSIVVLLSVIFYVAAVIFTELFGEMYDEGTLSVDYFGNLGKSLFTLFQVMTGSGWPDIAREVMETYNWAWFPFVLFLVVTMFIVVELTIAALCQSISRMELTGVDSDSAERDGDDDDTFTKNSDQRIFQLEEKVDRMTKETSVAADNASNSKVGMGGEVSDPAPATRARFSKRHSSSVEWYDKLSLSFADSQEKQTTSERSARQIDNSYNCFPEFIQSRCASIATNAFCQKAIVLFIVVNSITMGFATYNFVKGDAFTAAAFNTVDFVFLIIFTVELLIQFGYRGLAFFKSSWLVFDFFVISLSWMLPTVQVTRAFRIVRLFSRVRFMRAIISALAMVGPKLAVIGGLLLIMFYIMSIIFTDLFKDLFVDGLTSQDYFGSLGKTSFTLFQCMTIAGWPDIAREVMLTYEWAWVPFVMWIIVSKFTIIQLVVAVLCQSLAHVDEDFTDDEDEGHPSTHNNESVPEDSVDQIARLESKINALTSNIDALMLSKQAPSSTMT